MEQQEFKKKSVRRQGPFSFAVKGTYNFTAFINTRRYGPLRGPTSSSCGGLRPSSEAFFALRAK